MENNYDVVVVGAGPAGITASIYLKRANVNFLLLEKSTPGGLMNKTSIVENYPGYNEISGPDLAYKFYENILNLDIKFRQEEVISIEDIGSSKKIVTDKNEYITKAIILAVGRSPKKLQNTNEESLEGRGISFCSLCDGSLYKNEDVAIVGGGNSALEEALYLSEICKSVAIINRSESLKGDKVLIERVLNKKNISVMYNSVVSSFIPNNDNNVLESMDIEESGSIVNIKVKACFIFIGYEPATKFIKNLDILDDKGYIIVDSACRTKIKNIYAAGDILMKEAYQIVTATNDGAISAISCLKDLNDEE